MSSGNRLKIIGAFLGIVGLGIIGYQSIPLAIGVFLILWGNNVEIRGRS